MIVKVVIEPVNKLMKEQSIPCVYNINGKRRMLMEDDQVLEFDTVQNKDKPWPHTRILPNSKRGSAVLTYLYESDTAIQNLTDKRKLDAINRFWGQHPLLMVNGKATDFTKNALFNIVNFTDKSIESGKVWRDKLTIANHIGDMSYQEKVDLLHYYGESPKGKTENELILMLADFTTGIALKDEERDNFKRIWINNESSDKDIIIIVRKALTGNIIEQRTQDGRNSYYIGETFIGTAFNDIIAFCKREEKIYRDFILRQVNVKYPAIAQSPESKKAEVKTPLLNNLDVTIHTKGNTADELKEVEDLRAEARQLRKEKFLWQGLSIDIATLDALRIHVGNAREKKAKAQSVVA